MSDTIAFRPFDARVTLGRHLKLKPAMPHRAADLLDDMAHFGIAEALVLDSLARENHPIEGNRRILETSAQHPCLHPAWAALPPGAPDEQPSPAEMLEQMRRHRVGALFLFPRQYRFTLADYVLDALLEPLAGARVPVFINFNEVGRGGHPWDETDWDEVVSLCRRWPSLPIVVSEHRIRRANRQIYRAFDACPNLRLELSGYWLHRGIEYVTERWGSQRLVFGSNWPQLGHGCTLAMLTCAEISGEDKRNIAGGNLRELISWCDPVHAGQPARSPADPFVAFGRTGHRLADMTFLDCHGHIGGHACHYHLPHATLPETVREMERLGVRKACVFSFSVVFGDEQYGNDYVAEAVREFPRHFVGFAGLNLHRGRQAMLDELERCAALGLRGIKLIPHYQDIAEDDPLIDVACEWADAHRQLILNHHWGSPECLERLVSQYPDACFVTGHATDAYADLMRCYRNIYVCSCPVHEPLATERLVEAIGADRLLFGSDLQDLPIAWGLGPVLFARIDSEAKQLILGGNLARILAEYGLDL